MSNPSEHIDRQQVLKRALLELKDLRARLAAVEQAEGAPIAVVGLGCRFPGGADSPARFWQHLCAGLDAVREVPPERWDAAALYDPDPAAPGKTSMRQGGFLEQIDRFDALFFDISPREAAAMDPQQRLLLEVSWEALEHAGLAPDRLRGARGGVFVGLTANDYAQLHMKIGDLETVDAYAGTGNPFNFAAGRLAYLLGLHGPALALDTACSSSLVALHLAVRSLRQGECDLALAGGANLILLPEVAMTLSKARMLAADGRCKTFDAAADGYGRGEGCGMLVLKRLSDAQRDGDPILALIRGSAVNQNGAGSGITVPSAQAQQALLRAALADAGLTPAQVQYVEAHGTGTPLGDPIELRALAAVLGQGRAPDQPLLVGSVKTNLGHLEAAAGVAGLIKAVLMLQHGQIPPHLHLARPNPYINWEHLPVRVPTALADWPAGAGPRVAGVSAFGISGTNAHVLLEQAPAPAAPEPAPRPAYLLTLAARHPQALRALAGRLAADLAEQPQRDPADLCRTVHLGRAHQEQRLALVAESTAQFQEHLAAFAAGAADPARNATPRPTERPRVAFLFTGQGAQYIGMGLQLYQLCPPFRATVDRCAELLRPELGLDIRPLMFGMHDPAAHTDQERTADDQASLRLDAAGHGSAPSAVRPELDQTGYAQPALFVIEYALAELWRSWGVEPDLLIGHSLGEYVAACVAGVLSLEDALRLVAARGRLMQELPPAGAMAAVFAPAERVTAALEPFAGRLSLAALNGPAETVVAGERAALAELLDLLKAEGLTTRLLHVSHAFHSPLIEPILAPFARVAAGLRYAPARIPLISNLSGTLLAADQCCDADYWCRHARAPVQFAAGVYALHQHGATVWLEIGPHPTLLGLARRAGPAERVLQVPSLRRGRSDWQQMLESLAALYTHGAVIDWAAFEQGQPGRRIALPTYPWQRQRHWLAEAAPARRLHATASAPVLPGRRLPSPLKHIQFETELGVETVGLIGQHRIRSALVVPGVVYLELAVAALEQVAGPGLPLLDDLTLHQPLVLEPGQRRTVQLLLDPLDERAAEFQIFSQGDAEAAAPPDWRLHVSGRLRLEPAGLPPQALPDELAAAQARCAEALDAEQFYGAVWHPEFLLGPSFRCVERLWRRDGEALAYLRLPESGPAEQQVRADLLILDACVQALVATLPEVAGARPCPALYVGAGQRQARVFGPLAGAPVWCQALLCARPAQDELLGDLRVFDQHGLLLAELLGVRLKAAPAELAPHPARRAQPAEPPRLSRRQLLQAGPAERADLLVGYLGGLVALVLGLPDAHALPEQPLAGMLDSLMVVELRQRIERDLGLVVPVAVFFESPGLAELARWVEGQIAPLPRPAPAVPAPASPLMSVAELLAEARLDPALRPEQAAPMRHSRPEALLLTGASGFIGAFLLDELLRQTDATLYCLVRAGSAEQAAQRLRDNLRGYLLWDERLRARIIPVPGDLALPRLGLSEPGFARLAEQTDAIYHCGAQVKWTYPYRALKAANVDGTQTLLRLACTGRLKPFHFVSTVGVFSSPAYPDALVSEHQPLEQSGPLAVGYAQSKWVAEKLVALAGQRGLPVSIYRPATAGHSQTGAFNPNDHICRLIKGCLQLGSAPELDMLVDLAPVDYACAALVYLARQPDAAGRVFHLVNPRVCTWADLLDWMDGAGYRLRRLPFPEWLRELLAAEGTQNALAALGPFFAESLGQARLPRFDCRATLDALSGSALACPPIGPDLLDTYFRRFVSSGFIAAAPEHLSLPAHHAPRSVPVP